MCNKINQLFLNKYIVYLFLIIIVLFLSNCEFVSAIENTTIIYESVATTLGNITTTVKDIIIPNLCIGQQPKLNLSIILDEELYTNIDYTKLFRVDNLFYPEQKQDAIVNYSIIKTSLSHTNLSDNNYSFYDSFEVKDINKYKTADTGRLFLQEAGNYTLCGWLNQGFVNVEQTLNSSNDPILSLNNTNSLLKVCKNITINDLSNVNCDINLDIKIISNGNTSFFKNGDKLDIQFLINSTFPYNLEYWIDDIFKENVKASINTSSPKKQYTINSEKELDILFINAVLIPTCNDTNLSNNNLSKQLIIVNSKDDLSPSINIVDVYDEKNLKFGNSIRVKVNIIKINSSKNTIQAYVVDSNNKKLSEITKLSLFGKEVIQEVLLYIPLKESCSKSKHYIVIEGFDMEDKKPVSISCNDNLKVVEDKKSDIKNKSSNNKATNSVSSNNNSIISNLGYSGISTNLSINSNLNNNSINLMSNFSCSNLPEVHYIGSTPKINNLIKFFILGLLILNVIVILLNKN